MKTFCVAVADGARARFFTLREERGALVEVDDLINPAHQAKDAELYSTTKTGQRLRSDGHPNSVDDHRNAHDAEGERRFGKLIGEHLVALAKRERPDRVVVATSPKMKPVIAEGLSPLVQAGVAFELHTKDLTKLSPSELQAHLAKDGILPGYEPPRVR